MTSEALEHLEDAPIDEVACGIVFNAIQALDPIVVGSYWRERATEYPGHDIRSPLRDAAAVSTIFGVLPPMRSMLVSRDDQYVIQIQPDRFYFNWRRRKAGYPRFNTHGTSEGVLAIALREYRAFAGFCERTVGVRPQPKALELAKIDIMREGVYWNTLQQVAEILPCLRDFVAFTESDNPSFALRFNEGRLKGIVQINIALGAQTESNKGIRALSLETRLQRQLNGVDMEHGFKEANSDLNKVFCGLIPPSIRTKYFNKGKRDAR